MADIAIPLILNLSRSRKAQVAMPGPTGNPNRDSGQQLNTRAHEVSNCLAEYVKGTNPERRQHIEELDSAIKMHAQLFSSLLSITNSARQIIELWFNMRNWGCSPDDIIVGIRSILSGGMGDPKIIRTVVDQFANKQSFVAPLAPHIAKAGRFAGIASLAIKIAVAARDKEYSVIPAELYGFAVKRYMPYASLINMVQGLTRLILPEAQNSKLFGLLLTLDPVNRGIDAVDTFGVLLECWIDNDGAIPRLERLVKRMDKGGARALIGLGNRLGDIVASLLAMSDDEYNQTTQTSIDLRRWIEMNNWRIQALANKA